MMAVVRGIDTRYYAREWAEQINERSSDDWRIFKPHSAKRRIPAHQPVHPQVKDTLSVTLDF